MKILYYDCFTGISGDMNLAAMINLGVDKDFVVNELLKLKIDGYTFKTCKDNKMGIYGTRVDVVLDSEQEGHSHQQHKQHEHNHDHSHDHHGHAHSHAHAKDSHHHSHSQSHHHSHKPEGKAHSHEHRNLHDISHIINGSSLNDRVKEVSLKIFQKVAEAEAEVHGTTIDKVHFHEVGAVDSIVDIVGAAICFDYLDVDKVICSTIELGGGFVKCAHGMMPVPAPATAGILKDIPVKKGAVNFETTTPTGAAILSVLVDEFTDSPKFNITKTGYGIGHRDMEIPNILRVHLAQEALTDSTAGFGPEHRDTVSHIECNLDDMDPQQYGFVMDLLFKAGAKDVYMQQIIMKKNRPAVMLSVLCENAIQDICCNILLKHTTSFGLRIKKTDRVILKREFTIISTKYGDVKVKSGILNGKKIKSKPEYEDCKALAQKHGVSIAQIHAEVMNRL